MSPLSQSSLHGWIHAAISRERYMLWIRDLHHWIQQRRRFMKMCESIVPTPSTLKLWAPEVNMNLACMGEFVWPYIKNSTCYGHEICTIEYNKDWGLYVEALWQPHQIWSNEPLNSTIMCEFGLHGWIRVVISPEPYNLWTWIQQRWMLILCGNSVSWILFWGCVATIISLTLQPMDMRLVPLNTTIFCYTVHICTVISESCL